MFVRCLLVLLCLSLYAQALELSPQLRLFPSSPSMQLGAGGVLSFIPEGDLSGDPWEWPIVLGQFASSAAVNVGSAILFTRLASSGEERSVKEARSALLTWGLVQLAATPLLSASAVWGVGSLSAVHEVGYGWPLAVNYVVEVLLIAARIGIGYGLVDLEGADAVSGLEGLLGPYLVVDWLLHGIVVPATVTYFSLRSRSARGFGFANREAPVPAALLAQAPFRSEEEHRRRRSAAPAHAPELVVPLATLAF